MRRRPGIPRQIALILRAQYHEATKPFTPLTRPHTIPVQYYQTVVRTPIPRSTGRGSALVPASGTISVSVGPSGLGTIWYPQLAAIATTTGANDNSTCALYVTGWNTPVNPQDAINGQSYAGGGDSIGMAIPPIHQGECIKAVWTGGTNGDTATLTVYGDQDLLTL